MISAQEALDRLKEGNLRFVSGKRSPEASLNHPERAKRVRDQSPFAIILGCSDSRVPAELVFDQGIGDLFVIRVAGNIVARSQVGSIEYAADQFKTPLVVVMGHSHCGAVHASLDQLEQPTQLRSPNLDFIVQSIQPCIKPLLDSGWGGTRDELIARAVRDNIRASADQLRHGSEVLEKLIQDKGLLVVGAEYSLETGLVDFFDGVP